MAVKQTRIWLCDLTYTQQTIASDVMPAAVGCIATYAQQNLSSPPDVRVFKFPEKLAEALEKEPLPHVIGFSNYVWNLDLSQKIAQVIKNHDSSIVTVFGGPNYPTTKDEQENFVRSLPMGDFFILKEAESAFTHLVSLLEQNDFNVDKVPNNLPSIQRVTPEGEFDCPEKMEPRINIADIPSPYTSGLMDEFFDGALLPIIQTNRGCPFQCTFCVEGSRYYSKVVKSNQVRIATELNLISERMAQLKDQGRFRSDMFIADSNFGMYKEDLDTCHEIAAVRDKYGFPEYINVATGKNQKSRVLEAAKIIDGALRISGSVQSLDKQVLKNIERNNIDENDILDLALEASRIGANSYSEIILGLPGDSRDAHFKTIQTIIEADFNTVALFQLMLLPGTSMASRESTEKWKMVTRYRVLPRCYGSYEVLGETFHAAEIEQICIGNSALTFDEYLECRKMHLVINLFYNDAVFKEVLRLIKLLGLSKFAWMKRIWLFTQNDRINDLIKQFLLETKSELWESRDDLEQYAHQPETIQRYISGELGANLIFKYKSMGLTQNPHDLADVASKTLEDYLRAERCGEDDVRLGMDLIEFSRQRMTNLFTNNKTINTATFSFDVDRFSNDVTPDSVSSYKLDKPVSYVFKLSTNQRETIQNFIDIYGNSAVGIGRILTKVYVRKLYRIPERVQRDVTISAQSSSGECTDNDRGLTGLNEFI